MTSDGKWPAMLAASIVLTRDQRRKEVQLIAHKEVELIAHGGTTAESIHDVWADSEECKQE
jgi:hypothetical protein